MRKYSSGNTVTPDPDFVTVPNLAKQLGVKYHALLRAVNDGLVPSYKPFGDRRLVKPSEVIAFIERTREGGAK